MVIRPLGFVAWDLACEAMRAHTEARVAGDLSAGDEIWLCEHPPVYTLGVAGRMEHVHEPGDVPVVRTDRGGQVTYHGPGQVVAYPLIDLRARGIYVKEYVFRLETALLRTLAALGVTGHRVRGEPGIYVHADDPTGHAVAVTGAATGAVSGGVTGAGEAGADRSAAFAGLAKIAAIGIKVRQHCTYHGVALNVAMDLAPFGRIDPCGHPGLATTDLSTIGIRAATGDVAHLLGENLAGTLAL